MLMLRKILHSTVQHQRLPMALSSYRWRLRGGTDYHPFDTLANTIFLRYMYRWGVTYRIYVHVCSPGYRSRT
jgi:hypothetical protein